ncbi:MAG TPA: porin, partial [Polyangiaceae bacterium]|nr:porin [Polyangiaceae bacterium]
RNLGGGCRRNIKYLVWALSLAATSLVHREAAAEFSLAKQDGWELKLDGRLNAFISFAQGDKVPEGVAEWTGGLNEEAAPNGDKIMVTRIRSGFVQNVLGFTLSKEVATDYKLTGRFGLYAGASNERKPVLGSQPDVQAREAFIRLEAPWGTVEAGRNLGLFGRGGISMDYEIVHGMGLGSPCSTHQILGGACGFAGHGILFPGFNAGFLYSTPKVVGLQATAGVYDPSLNSERGYLITPYPRIEGQVAYNFQDHFKVFGEAMWQRLINQAPLKDNQVPPMVILDSSGKPTNQVADATGFAAGASFSGGPVQVGGAFYTGTGMTLIVPIFNTPILTDGINVLRKGQGFVGMASLTFGGTKIAGGGGVSQLKLTPFDKQSLPFSQQVPPKQQLGVSIGLYQTMFKQLTWALEYFRGQYTWYDYKNAAGAVAAPKQNINFVNTGLTLIF